MLKTNGMRQETAERLLLDAGAVYKNLTYEQETGEFTATLLGATSGGNEFNAEIEYRQPEIDGAKGRIKGLEFINAHNAYLTINMKELVADTLRLAIGAADIKTDDPNYDIIQPRKIVKNEDYLDNIAWVGRLSKGGRPVVIVLDNVLSAEGFSMTPEDSNEAIVPITLYAHADLSELESDEAPYRIYWPKGAPETPEQQASTQSTNDTESEEESA
ncbi:MULTISPECIES: hypothetical protein [unclassified Oceanobacillus]|uniref:hypothetical protein n=1 Tax=unclassified Oceanobacillus TaxID=2630292 RepID=UPI001BEAD456|nr:MULTISPECIES: hypothetical protein [unclassified Oceanobacillus]MBT2601424.1 hypothetical protein [Oceanobacillus sp. ISL-74]MBT2653299.1 hypothetical protein [Oceanobacillus sp. ISL-73]